MTYKNENGYLCVNESLDQLSDFYNLTYFNANQLKSLFKSTFNRIGYRKEIEEPIKEITFSAKGKKVIVGQNLGTLLNINFFTSPEAIKSQFEQNKHKLLDQKLDVYELVDLLKPHFRSEVVKYYFKKNYSQYISKEVADYCSRSGNDVYHIAYSYGFIGSFKKKLLGQFDGKELYWMRFLYNNKSMKVIEDNLGNHQAILKNKDVLVFYPEKGTGIASAFVSKTTYIDVFSSDSSIANFLRLAGDPNYLGFVLELTPLIEYLKKLDLLHV